jgi:nucleotide-binding universal stress UspA family protein
MKLLIGIDGSEHSLAALKFASRLLDAERDTVVLHYSVPTVALESLRPESEEVYSRARDTFADAVFQQATDLLPADLRASCIKVQDKQRPHKGLLTTAAAQDADLLVVGARGTGPIQRLLLGSVSHAVARACELPTLIVRGAPSEESDAPLSVLIACAGVETDRAIATTLQELTWPSGSQADLIHVIESLFAGEIPDWLLQEARSSEVELQARAWVLEHEQEKQAAEKQMRQYCQSLPTALSTQDVLVVEGNPAQKILERLETKEYDLTVLGTQGLGRVMRMLLGSTSEYVLTHSPGSVLIVPHDGR